MKIVKSRDIPLVELFSNLQLEYLSYKFRELLYEREQDIQKFHDICIKKREKIENLGFRNQHASIFSDKQKFDSYLSKFLNEWGLPNFCYRDDYQRKVKGHWDEVYYFSKGSLIKVKSENGILDGTLIKFINATNIIVDIGIKVHLTVSSDNVSRIISEDFINQLT